MSLADKVILVTGGTRGIGRALAKGLARERATLVVNYHQEETAALTLLEEIGDTGAEAISIKADVSQSEEALRVIEVILSRYGRIDVLINNLGPFLEAKLEDTTPEQWQYILATNLHSCFYCSRLVLEPMGKQGWGRIINVAFSGAQHIQARYRIVPYAIAKTGILLLTKALALVGAKQGITVNVISPGVMETEGLSEPERRDWLRRIPCGRLGLPDDIVSAVSFLISPEADYITGTNLIVSGGWQL